MQYSHLRFGGIPASDAVQFVVHFGNRRIRMSASDGNLMEIVYGHCSALDL
jgi:hypothetical protein